MRDKITDQPVRATTGVTDTPSASLPELQPDAYPHRDDGWYVVAGITSAVLLVVVLELARRLIVWGEW